MDKDELLNGLSALGDKATADEKEDLAKKVAALLESPLSSEENLKIAQALIRTLAADAEKSVRQTIASYMRSNSQLPKDVALNLAKDVESIALPIIESSSLLTEQELIDIVINSNSAAKQMAVARRDDVTENVSSALVTHAKADEVITTLLENKTAQISIDSLTTIVEKKSGNESIMQSLAERTPMPVEIIQKITSSVSDRIREAILAKMQNKYGISQHQLGSMVDHSEAISVLKILDQRTTLFDARSLVTNLIDTKKMRPDIFMTALLMGKRHFVKYAVAMLSDKPLSELEKILEAPMMPMKFEAMLDKANLLSTFAIDIFWTMKFIETDAIVGKPTAVVVNALYDHIGANPERFPNAQYFRMMLQSQPAFSEKK